MTSSKLFKNAHTYLHKLCVEIPTRRVGSQGNQAATTFYSKTIAAFGFEVESQSFECIDWIQGGRKLTINGSPFEVFVSPYSLSCTINAPLEIVSTVDELSRTALKNKIVLLSGDLTKEQLMPKNFPFYNPDEHKHIYSLLENKKPLAIIAATSRNPELAGAVYPFPLIEDGDFDIPSVYMTEEEGQRLAHYGGQSVNLEIKAKRIPANGCNVIARRGERLDLRVVIFAHIDAKDGTPGALDNATGVVTLLLLAELLAEYNGSLGIEIVALNGEDYYAASGEKLWINANQGKFQEILLGINIDGLGYHRGKTAYSHYGLPSEIEKLVVAELSTYQEMEEGDPWFQSDHSLFIQNQRPALAFTSNAFSYIWSEIAHTPKDTPELVDVKKLVSVAFALHALIRDLKGNQY